MKNVALLTSGGDAPGMNACIRAITRALLFYNMVPFGIERGYAGMIDGNIKQLSSRAVSNIIQRGGTILKSARCEAFKTKEGRAKAFEHLQDKGIEALIVIGGDGSFKGAMEFSKEYDLPVVGIPGTIDNDMFGTDFTIGYDTAINTAVEAIDKIRDTADAHSRLFIVEVMGRDAGLIALRSGIGCGAEDILVPETKTKISDVVKKLHLNSSKSKTSNIIVVAEGDDFGGAVEIADAIKLKTDAYDIRVTILGHLQRGGNPSAMDRVLASRLGVAAVEGLIHGHSGNMVGVVNHEVQYTSLEKATKHNYTLNEDLMRMAEIISG